MIKIQFDGEKKKEYCQTIKTLERQQLQHLKLCKRF